MNALNFRKIWSSLLIGWAVLAASTLSAHAHHPMGDETPSTLWTGFVSGLAHPVIGLDHLAFVGALGIAAWIAGKRILLTGAFVLAALLGTAMRLAEASLPASELIIAASVAAIGIALMSGRKIPATLYGGFFLVAGTFHGYAYGEAVIGAEATPLIAYLSGFSAIQFAVAMLSGWLVCEAAGKRLAPGLSARLTGAMAAGAGALLVGEHAVDSLVSVLSG